MGAVTVGLRLTEFYQVCDFFNDRKRNNILCLQSQLSGSSFSAVIRKIK